jgi:hypothetical protein
MANGRRPNLFDSRLSSRFFNPRANELYMDTSLLNYAPQDTFNYNRIDPASLQMQSVDQLPYDPSTLQTVYQSLPPVQGPQPFVGPPSPSLNMDSGTLGASIYSAQDFDTEEEMMLAGAESLGWKYKFTRTKCRYSIRSKCRCKC